MRQSGGENAALTFRAWTGVQQLCCFRIFYVNCEGHVTLLVNLVRSHLLRNRLSNFVGKCTDGDQFNLMNPSNGLMMISFNSCSLVASLRKESS